MNTQWQQITLPEGYRLATIFRPTELDLHVLMREENLEKFYHMISVVRRNYKEECEGRIRDTILYTFDRGFANHIHREQDAIMFRILKGDTANPLDYCERVTGYGILDALRHHALYTDCGKVVIFDDSQNKIVWVPEDEDLPYQEIDLNSLINKKIYLCYRSY